MVEKKGSDSEDAEYKEAFAISKECLDEIKADLKIKPK